MSLSGAEGILIVGLSLRKEVQKKNFDRTMRSSWSFDRIVQELKPSDELINTLRSLVGGVPEFRIWGYRESKRKDQRFLEWWGNAEKYVAIFVDVSSGSVICWGRIFAKILSEKLSEALWGTNKWRYVYFLRDVVWINGAVPIAKLVKELGCKENYKPRGHQPVASEKVQEVIKRFGSIENFLQSLLQSKPNQVGLRSGTTAGDTIANVVKLLSEIVGGDAIPMFLRVVGRVARGKDHDVKEVVNAVLTNAPEHVRIAVADALAMLRQRIEPAVKVLASCGEKIASVLQDPDLVLGALVVSLAADSLGGEVVKDVIDVANNVVKENLFVVMLCRLYNPRVLG
jgi:hypothetical protein